MGLYDRDYYQDEPKKRKTPFSSWSAVATIIALNVGLYFIDQGVGGRFFEKMAISGLSVGDPSQWYRCLTYGFAHDPGGFFHILGNMATLFFLGPPVERAYGKKEFWCVYLASIVICGIAWSVLHAGSRAAVLGASGAITTIVILFALNFPKVQLLLWGIIPLPAWVAGVLFILYDAYGVHDGSSVAHDVHLVGALLGGLYFFSKIRLSNLFSGKRLTARTTKTVYARQKTRDRSSGFFSFGKKGSSFSDAPDNLSIKVGSFQQLEEEVDRILLKISRSGEASLTEEERNTLFYASQEYQKRKR